METNDDSHFRHLCFVIYYQKLVCHVNGEKGGCCFKLANENPDHNSYFAL